MPDLPPEAIQAAAAAIDNFPRKGLEVKWEDYQQELARAVLEAAAPHIEAAVRERAVRLAAIYLGPRVLRKYAASLEPEDAP